MMLSFPPSEPPHLIDIYTKPTDKIIHPELYHQKKQK